MSQAHDAHVPGVVRCRSCAMSSTKSARSVTDVTYIAP